MLPPRSFARGYAARGLPAHADPVGWLVGGSTRELGSPAEPLKSRVFRNEYLGPGYPGLPGTEAGP